MGKLGSIYESVRTGIAEEAITAGLAVKLGAAEGGMVLCDTANEPMEGVALQDAASGEEFSYLKRGRYDGAIGAGSINANAALAVTAAGKFTTYATGTQVGHAVSPCGGADEAFTIEIG